MGFAAAHAPAKRVMSRSRNKRGVAKRQDLSADVSVVVSGTIVATSLWESYCNAASTAKSTHSTSTHTTSTKSILSTATGNPTATTNTLATLPTVGPIRCYNKADFPAHANVEALDEKTKSDGFCNGLGSGDYPETSPGHPSPGFISFTNQNKVNYAFTLTWAPDCQMAFLNMTWPTGPPSADAASEVSTCTTIMENNYLKCRQRSIIRSLPEIYSLTRLTFR